MGGLARLLPGRASCRLRIRASVDAPAARPAAVVRPARSAASPARVAADRGDAQRAVCERQPCARVARHPRRERRPADVRRLHREPGPAALVLGKWRRSIAGPLLPLRRVQRRKLPRPACLSDAHRTATDAHAAVASLDGCVHGLCDLDGHLCASAARGAPRRGSRNTPSPCGLPHVAAAPALDRARSAALEPHAGHDQLHHDGDRLVPTSLGSAARRVPRQFRPRVRAQAGFVAHRHQPVDWRLGHAGRCVDPRCRTPDLGSGHVPHREPVPRLAARAPPSRTRAAVHPAPDRVLPPPLRGRRVRRHSHCARRAGRLHDDSRIPDRDRPGARAATAPRAARRSLLQRQTRARTFAFDRRSDARRDDRPERGRLDDDTAAVHRRGRRGTAHSSSSARDALPGLRHRARAHPDLDRTAGTAYGTNVLRRLPCRHVSLIY